MVRILAVNSDNKNDELLTYLSPFNSNKVF